jgi:prolyl 4-hydroxylase
MPLLSPFLTHSHIHSSPDFESSYISGSRGKNTLAIGRTSTSAPLPLEHPLVSCILDRARTFMGSMLLPHEPFSVPQLVRYFPGQKYDLHADFWPKHQVMKDGSARLFNRAASFFVYLRDNCTGGYTYFPRVEPTGTSAANPASDEDLEKWYGDTVARGEKDGKELGLKFKPIKGNAIFWVNLDERGEGDRRVVHAGLPVEEGEKIGLNLWPRKFFGWEGRDKEDKKEEGKKRWNGKWRE